jgi:hypothetical protein
MVFPGARGGAVKKPKPFQRPGVELSTGSQKQWVRTRPEWVKPGDIIMGEGLVVDVELNWTSGYEARKWVIFSMKSGKRFQVDQSEQVTAFTDAEGEPVG